MVTSGHGDPAATLDAIHAAARAGLTLIQVREPRLDDRTLLAFVRSAIDAAAGTGARVVVNERADIARAAGAAGVHLREGSMAASRVRAIVPQAFLVGRSVHSVESARQAQRDGACDYLVFGTVYRSDSKPAGHPVAGLDALREVCAAVTLPVLAIGGITLERVTEVAAAGAAGIAAIGLFLDARSAAKSVTRARRAFDTHS